jgi:VWFA-related protein
VKAKVQLAPVLIMLTTCASLAQQPARQTSPKDEDVVRITTNLVQVDAVVVDKDGKRVTDLKPDEVQILEDDRPQKITHFSYMAGATAAAPAIKGTNQNAPVPPVALKPEQVQRTIAVVVDDLGLSYESTQLARHALKKFVDDQMQPGDLVAIIRTSGGIGALQQFTSDKRQLYAAIDHVKWYAGGRGVVGAFAPLGTENLPDTNAEVQASYEDLQQFREELFTVGTLGAINYVIGGLKGLPGRKSVILLSDGIQFMNHVDLNRQKTMMNPSTLPNTRDRVMDALQRLTDAASRAAVVIYPIDARGLQSLQLTAADRVRSDNPAALSGLGREKLDKRAGDFRDSQDGLNYLAAETGGFFVHNSNDLGLGIRRVLEDQSGYYLIGYRPDESTFDPRTGRRKFHHLSMKVTRPGKYTVRMRNGFFGFADAAPGASALTPRDQIIGALTSPFGSAGVHLQLTSLFGNDAKVGSFMRSMLHVDANDLTFTKQSDGWRQATFDVVAVTFGDNGNVVDELSRTDAFRVSEDGFQEVLKHGFLYFVVLPIKKAGAYQLRTVLRDHDSERIGTAAQFVEVPDLKKDHLALSGLMINAVSKSGGETNHGSAPAAPESGEAVRQFKTGMFMRYGFVIYNARLDKNTRQPQLQVQMRLFRNGQVVFTGRVQPFTLNSPPDVNRLAADGGITLGADLVPGEYVCQVIVNDLLADEKHRSATQWLDFEIVK